MQLGKEAGNLALASCHACARIFDQSGIEAQACGDVETGRFPGRPEPQHIGRFKRIFIETHGAVLDPGRGCAIHLHGHEMGGGNGERAAAAERFEHCDPQRPAFLGVRRAAQFVHEHERIRRGAFEHRTQGQDVC